MVYDIFNVDAADAIKKANELSERLDKLEEKIEATKKGILEIIPMLSDDESTSDLAYKEFTKITGESKLDKIKAIDNKNHMYYKKQL